MSIQQKIRSEGGTAADWAIEAPARNRAAPAEHFCKAKICVSANSTLTAYLQPQSANYQHHNFTYYGNCYRNHTVNQIFT